MLTENKFAFTKNKYIEGIFDMNLYCYEFHHHFTYNGSHSNGFHNVILSKRHYVEQLPHLYQMMPYEKIYTLLPPNP